MADGFFRVKNGLNLPTFSANPTVTPPANSSAGDMGFFGGKLYIYDGTAWGIKPGSGTTGLIVNADVDAAAAIAGTKVAPNFGSQNVTSTGTATFNTIVTGTQTSKATLSYTTNTARTYTIPDAGADANFVMTAGTQTIGGTLTLPATVNYTSNGSIVKSGTGAFTLNTSTFASGLTFSGAFTLTVPATGTAALLATSNTFTVAQTISAASNQLILSSGVNQVTVNSGTSAAARTYTIPDMGATANFAMTEGAQTINGAKTFGSAITVNVASNQLALGTTNKATISATAPAAARTYTIPDPGANADFVMTAGTQTIGGTLTLPSTVNYTSNGSIVKSGTGAFTLNTSTFASGLTFSGAFTLTVPATGTAALLGTSNNFTVAQTISAASNQVVLSSGVNQLTVNSGTSAAARTYTVPDVGATANFVMTQGTATINGDKTFGSAPTAPGYIINSSAFNAQTIAYTLQSSDNGKIVTVNSSTAVNVTVPSGLAVGFNCSIIQLGTGQLTLVASGVTLNSANGLKSAAQHAAISIVSYSSNVYNVSGNTVI